MEFSSANSFMMQAQMAQRNNMSPALNIDNLTNDQETILNAALEFEAYFIQVMFREMRSTINTESGILPQSQAQEIFQDMLDEQTARSAAANGGIGLAQQIFRQFTASRHPLQIDIYNNMEYNAEYGVMGIDKED